MDAHRCVWCKGVLSERYMVRDPYKGRGGKTKMGWFCRASTACRKRQRKREGR